MEKNRSQEESNEDSGTRGKTGTTMLSLGFKVRVEYTIKASGEKNEPKEKKRGCEKRVVLEGKHPKNSTGLKKKSGA